MQRQPLDGVFQRIRALAAVRADRKCSDRELLGRFVEASDESAFTVLVERHGPMVLGLCRRLLRQGQDAEDACQATFLVLARRAAALRKRESLASWLHGIAYRICANLKRREARRQRRERATTRPVAINHDDGDITWRELRGVLDEELQRLPERYRAPLVLCYLEGKTRDEAAEQLGASAGALHGLLERGRKLLRDRLQRRGLTLSAALFASGLPEAVQAALPPALAVASASAAVALSRGNDSVIAANVLNLVQEASTTMLSTKLKIGAAFVVAAGMLTTLAGGSLHSVSQAQDAAPHKALGRVLGENARENDEQFIRRISKDLRGVDPTPAEIHFFTANKDEKRRQKLIDLFIQERQAKEKVAEAAKARHTVVHSYRNQLVRGVAAYRVSTSAVVKIQGEFLNAVAAAAKEKKDLAIISQRYLDQLLEYVKAHPKHQDIPDAMLQITLVYRSLGKTVEADAWRDKLRKEHPQSPAAKTAQSGEASERTLGYFLVDTVDGRANAELYELYFRQALGIQPSEREAIDSSPAKAPQDPPSQRK